MKLLIGCPTLGRAWIFPKWFDHVEKACTKANIIPEFIFVSDPADESYSSLTRPRKKGYKVHLVNSKESQASTIRDWNPSRYDHMTKLRNILLSRVRKLSPEYFFSLDSDILLHENCIVNLLESIQNYDAVGASLFMTPHIHDYSAPSWASYVENGVPCRENRVPGVYSVDIIMAAILMNKSAYNIDYTSHPWGEDTQWSLNCHAAGLRLGWDNRCINKHVMEIDLLDKIDPRVGF